MTAASIQAWESEMKMLLASLRDAPSRDHAGDRERIAVLQKLIAGARAAAG